MYQLVYTTGTGEHAADGNASGQLYSSRRTERLANALRQAWYDGSSVEQLRDMARSMGWRTA